MDRKSVGILVGSLRDAAYSRQVADVLSAKLRNHFDVRDISIGQLPLYNQDLDDENRPPAEWVTFRSQVKPLDALVFVTPEHNRSFPAAMKNALDVGSRPYGQNVWDGKPAAVVSTSPGAIGGFGANHHLRQMLTFLNVYPLQQPEVYLSGVNRLIDAQGQVASKETDAFLSSFIDQFVNWVGKF